MMDKKLYKEMVGNMNIINDKKIICYFDVVKGMKEEVKILKGMLDYIIDDMYDGDIDIREYIFNSVCCNNNKMKYILEVVDWYS